MSQGFLPANPSRAELLWYLAANYHVWAAGIPLWELPPDVGAEFLALCQSLQPFSWVMAEQQMEAVLSK